jgi:hypothetical protein
VEYYSQVPGQEAAAFESRARRLLGSWLDSPKFSTRSGDLGADIIVEQGAARLAVQVKGDSAAAPVGGAIAQVKRAAKRLGRRTVPVVAVPFMGDIGQRLCEEAGVSWFDLSGNAHIVAPGLRILIEGKPNQFLRRGKPSSPYAPKSARIARHLLIEPLRFIRQQDLARETGLDDGFTSRIVSRLEDDELIDRDASGAIRVRNPGLMLDAWAEVYSFERHSVLRGHITSRTSEELLASMAGALDRVGMRYAATGLAAAWLHTEFAGFRLVTLFVEHYLDDVLLQKLGFREEPKGANVWLVIPNDEGVFDGATKKQKVSCVHPVQAYLDLLSQPERAKDAAAELRSRMLQWKS